MNVCGLLNYSCRGPSSCWLSLKSLSGHHHTFQCCTSKTWRAIHFNDFYNHGDERATINKNYTNHVPGDVASRSRKMHSSSTIRLATAPTHSPSQDLPLSQHLHKVTGICNKFPTRPNMKNACTNTPLPLLAFFFVVPPT